MQVFQNFKMQPPQTESFPPTVCSMVTIYFQHHQLGCVLTSFLPLNEVSGAGMALTLYRNILITRRKAESQLKEEKAGQQRDKEWIRTKEGENCMTLPSPPK